MCFTFSAIILSTCDVILGFSHNLVLFSVSVVLVGLTAATAVVTFTVMFSVARLYSIITGCYQRCKSTLDIYNIYFVLIHCLSECMIFLIILIPTVKSVVLSKASTIRGRWYFKLYSYFRIENTMYNEVYHHLKEYNVLD